MDDMSFAQMRQACGEKRQGGECRTEYRKRARYAERKKKEKSFWEKRAERHKLFMDLATKAWYRRENERKYQEQIAFARKDVSSALLRQQALERATGKKGELGVNQDVLSAAATELAQSYVFFKIPSARMNPKPKSMR